MEAVGEVTGESEEPGREVVPCRTVQLADAHQEARLPGGESAGFLVSGAKYSEHSPRAGAQSFTKAVTLGPLASCH